MIRCSIQQRLPTAPARDNKQGQQQGHQDQDQGKGIWERNNVNSCRYRSFIAHRDFCRFRIEQKKDACVWFAKTPVPLIRFFHSSYNILILRYYYFVQSCSGHIIRLTLREDGEGAGAAAAAGAGAGAGMETTTLPSECVAAWQRAKSAGNNAFKEKRYADAASAYVRALSLVEGEDGKVASASPADGVSEKDVAALHSNLSASMCGLGHFQDALESAERAVEACPDWVKAHARKAKALAGLERYGEARRVYTEALALDECAQSPSIRTWVERSLEALVKDGISPR